MSGKFVMKCALETYATPMVLGRSMVVSPDQLVGLRKVSTVLIRSSLMRRARCAADSEPLVSNRARRVH